MDRVNQPSVKAASAYTEFHPRWYRPHVSVYWWLGEWRYLRFILRELSSVFVAGFVIVTLLELRALHHGPQAYARFVQRLQTPMAIVFSTIGFFFVVFHSITWFNLAPSATAVRFRGRRLPDIVIAAPNYAVWLLVSLAVTWVLLR
jgi:fumarate reductase subunit C